MVRPTELAAEPGDRVAVTGRASGDGLVGAVESIGPGPEAAVAPGERKTAVILFTFPGDPATPWSADETRSKVFTGAASVSDFYEEESYGDVSLTGKLSSSGDIFGWLHINAPTAGCPYGEWRLAADDAAAEAGIDLGGYDHLIYMFPRQFSCTWEGIEGVAANGIMLNGNQSVQVIAHEMGHSLGLQHAGSWTCTSGGARVQISGNCTMTQYGDPFDIMGNIAARHSNGEGLEKLGFLAPENVRTIDSSGVYQLHSALHPTSEPTVLRIRRKTTFSGETSYYYLEVREGGGIFENVSDATTAGVSIRVTGESYSPETLLIDANPATATFQDAPLGVGQTFEGGPVRITTQSAGGGSASVSVTLDEAPPTPPTALTASAGPGGVSLQWQASSDNFGVDHYVVVRDGSEIASPSAAQFRDSDATVGDHTYRVIAEDEVGNRSAASDACNGNRRARRRAADRSGRAHRDTGSRRGEPAMAREQRQPRCRTLRRLPRRLGDRHREERGIPGRHRRRRRSHLRRLCRGRGREQERCLGAGDGDARVEGGALLRKRHLHGQLLAHGRGVHLDRAARRQPGPLHGRRRRGRRWWFRLLARSEPGRWRRWPR